MALVPERDPGDVAAGPSWELRRSDALLELGRIADSSVDMLLTDPPYSSGGLHRGDRTKSTAVKYTTAKADDARPTFEGDSRDQRSFLAWCSLWLAETYRVLRPGAIAAVFCDWRQQPTMTDAIQAAGFTWRGVVAWDKTESVRPQLGRYRQAAEFVVWGTRGPRAMEGAIGPGVVRCRRDAEASEHVTGKPVALLQELLVVAPHGGLVLDPFAGSGSTGVAALRTGRRFLGIELGADHFAIAADRLAAERGDVDRAGRQLQLGEVLAPS